MTAKQFGFYDEWKNEKLVCPHCGWEGTFHEGAVGYFSQLMDCTCPKCEWPNDPILAIVSYPTQEETEANYDNLSDAEKKEFRERKQWCEDFDEQKLTSPDQLPDLHGEHLRFVWDFVNDDGRQRTVVSHEGQVVWDEPAVWEGYWRFEEVVRILQAKYGERVVDMEPTLASSKYLYGDRLSSPKKIDELRRSLKG